MSPEVQAQVMKALDDGNQNLALEILKENAALVPPKGFEEEVVL